MLMLDMHRQLGTNKHEPYLETNNKRPGAALGETEAEKNEMLARRNFSWNKEHFLLTSARLELQFIDWKKVLNVHCAKSSSSGIFFAS